MRKLFSLGLLVLILGGLGNTALAGALEDCEFLKDKEDPSYSPGLYGLCVAYANAENETARAAISGNYDKKNENGAPPLDEIFGGGGGPTFNCNCWASLSYDDACKLANDATSMVSGVSSVVFIDLVAYMTTFFGANASSCQLKVTDIITGDLSGDLDPRPVSGPDAEDCVAELAVIGTLRGNADLCVL